MIRTVFVNGIGIDLRIALTSTVTSPASEARAGGAGTDLDPDPDPEAGADQGTGLTRVSSVIICLQLHLSRLLVRSQGRRPSRRSRSPRLTRRSRDARGLHRDHLIHLLHQVLLVVPSHQDRAQLPKNPVVPGVRPQLQWLSRTQPLSVNVRHSASAHIDCSHS